MWFCVNYHCTIIKVVILTTPSGVPLLSSTENLSCTESNSAAKLASEMVVKKVFGCGCGSCSFLSFIEEGCPHPITTKSGLPYLDTSQLSKAEKDLLLGRLIGESQEMVFTFQRLVFRTSQSLRDRQISPQLIGESLLCLRALDPVFPGPQVPLFSALSTKLLNATSVTDIIHAIFGYLSFFNYHVIEHLIQVFGVQEDKEELEKYKGKLNEYCKRRVFESPPLYSLPGRSDHVVVAVKLDDDLTKYTLKSLRIFWLRLAKELKLLKHSLRIVSVEEGCMQLIFEIPSLVSHQIFPLSIEQENALRDEKVIELKCEDYIFSSKVRL